MTKFIAVVSGKGGVGKTTSTLNIGHALTQLGHKSLLVDANLVTPNIAIKLGMMDPDGTLNKYLRKEKDLKEVTYHHESGVSIIPASPSYHEYQKTNAQHLSKIFNNLEDTSDFVLIDAPSGLGYEVSQVLKHSDEALIIVNPNLSSVMDALKTIELAKAHDNQITGIILNMTHGGKHEMKQEEVEQILGHPVLGNVKYDRKVRKSLHKQAPLTHLYPRSKSAKEFRRVAEYLSHYTI